MNPMIIYGMCPDGRFFAGEGVVAWLKALVSQRFKPSSADNRS